MKHLFCLLIFAATSAAESPAQVKPSFFPEDVTPGGIESPGYCKPGVRCKSRSKGLKINYTLISAGTFKPEGEPFSEPFSSYRAIQQYEVDLKAPLLRRERFKLLAGYEFFTERYSFKRFGADFSAAFRELDERRLKKSTFHAIATKPLDGRHYLALRLSYTSNGDYPGFIRFKSRYSIYKVVALFVRKPHEDFEWGLGLNLSMSFRKTNVLPFLVFNRTFNEKWGVESVFPASVLLRHNLNDANILLAGAEYESQSYRFGVPDPAAGELDYALNHSEVVASVKLEHRWAGWLWSKVKVGWQVNFSTDFESKSAATPSFHVEPTNGLFFQLGAFLSPPDDMLDRK